MKRTEFDLIVIGAGSGGLAVAETAAQLGQKVLMVEGGSVGGTCVNNGCVPKKVMWYGAEIIESLKMAPAYGINALQGSFDWGRLVSAREAFINDIRRYWDGYVEQQGITTVNGFARFIDSHTVAVNDAAYSAPHIVISTGSQAVVPPVDGAHFGMTSDGFFELTEQPARVAIIGGGYIGVELAGVLNAFGSSVELFAREQRLLHQFDPMIGEVLAQQMTVQGIQLHFGADVNGLQQADSMLTVNLANQSFGDFDKVIWAVGRSPNTGRLDLHAAELATGHNGTILVDEYQNTSVPGVYAIGDVTGQAALTPVAIAAGRKLAARLFGGATEAKVDYEDIPSVVFAHPPIATIGLTETAARAKYGNSVTIYQSDFTPMRFSLTDIPSRTVMKLVCVGADERIVGIHLIGHGVDEMLQGFAVALRMGATKADFDRTIAIHPSSAEELVTMKRPLSAIEPEELLKAS